MGPSDAVVLIRADASRSIGRGHVSRCRTLAAAFASRGAKVRFAVARPEVDFAEWLTRVAMSWEAIDAERGSRDDALATEALATRLFAELVVIDGYAFDASYEAALRSPSRVVCAFDDMVTPHGADVVIQHGLAADRSQYPSSSDVEYLLGPSYALVRPEFVRARARRRDFGSPPHRVLVTFGASDPVRMTERVLEALGQVNDALALEVVIGQVSPDRRIALEALARAIPHPVSFAVDVDDPWEVMARCDVAIVSGGVTALELATVGVPALVVAIADNQVPGVQALAERSMMLSLGFWDTCTAAQVTEGLGTLLRDPMMREALVARQRAVFDGGGPARLAERLLEVRAKRKREGLGGR